MSPSTLTRPSGRNRPGRLLALLTATAVAASLLSAPGPTPAAAGQPITTAPDAVPVLAPGGAEPVAVTLITGDTVYWQDGGGGNTRVAEIVPAPRDYPVTFDQSGTAEDFYVIPSDAMEHVVARALDEELFNIPGLIRQGFDDATTDELPVIVTFDHDRSAQRLTRDADALPATAKPTAVEHMNGAGVAVNRGKAGAFRQAVFGKPGREGSTRTTGALGVDGAVEKVMLDRVLEIDLAESVPQIGAPQVWDAGFTGEGVTVAVLDTGVDSIHPDLAGQVVAEANFTDEPDATDTHGHGTHVASTIAGTGAASDGARTGVAPGADLLNGKVCRPTPDGDGICQTSWIMAGMEWATAQGADVVNMSLGGEPTDGTDPLSQLVNDLSAQTDTLFVTSAGNFGCALRVVGSPAAADAALAVAAVTKSDQRASFSSCGPRVGDHAVKPEITAPGVGIVAARAAGTTIGDPVEDDYTSLNGTSMASPHVAGAAALLAQAEPDLGWSGLKDTLVSTAADVGHLLIQQGTGRVDVPAAVSSPVYAQGTLNFGGVDGQAERTITYTNRGDEDITLTLQPAVTDSFGRPTDLANLFLQAETLTVPAHGNASVAVAVTLDTSDLTGQESFSGMVTATAPGIALRTGIGFGPPLNRVTFEVLDSTGQRIGSDTAPDTAIWLTVDDFDWEAGGSAFHRLFTEDGVATAHLSAGTYTAMINLEESEPDTGRLRRNSALSDVEFVVDADLAMTLDARDAVPVDVAVPRRVDPRNLEVSLIREYPASGGRTFTLQAASTFSAYVTPAPAGVLAPVRLYVKWILAEPLQIEEVPGETSCPQSPQNCYSDTPSYLYSLPFTYENGIPGDLGERVTRADLVEIPRRYHSDHTDALVMHQFSSAPSFPCTCGGGSHSRIWFRPGKVTEYVLADDRFTWAPAGASLIRRPEGQPQSGIALFTSDWFPTAEAGSRRDEESWFEAPLRMGAVDVRAEFFSSLVMVPREAVASRGGTDGNLFEPGTHVLGNTRGHFGTLRSGATWRMWNLDTDTELDPVALGRRFSLSPHLGTYKLEQVESYPADTAPVFRTGRATTVWRFTSQPSDAIVPNGYVCPSAHDLTGGTCQIQPLIQLEYHLGLDLHNQAPAGRAHRFSITAGHHSGAVNRAPVTNLHVQASFDDGDTWREARVVGEPRDTWDTGGFLPSERPYQQFRVVLMIPPLHHTDGFVSLRVSAADANGGSVEQTILRAYILK